MDEKWDVDVKIGPLFANVKYQDFKKPIEELYKYYKNDYFKKLLKIINNYKFEKNNNIIYLNDNSPYINQILYYYIYNFKKILLITLFPNYSKNNELITLLKKQGKIHFIKEMRLSYKEVQPLFFQLYANTDKMKNLDSINQNIKKYGWEKGHYRNIKIIFYEPNNILNFELLDENIHITHGFEHALEIGGIYLNYNNFIFYRKIRFDRFMRMLSGKGKIYFLNFKEWLFKSFMTIDIFRVLIFSSFIFYISGLRQPSDLDVIIYHYPKKAKTKNFSKKMKELSDKEYIDLSIKGYGDWVSGGKSEYLDEWFLKDWPNLFGAKNYEEMIFDPRFHINFLGIKVINLDADIKRREKRCRAAAYSNIIAIKLLMNKNIQVPKIPESYWQAHQVQYYKTVKEKKVLLRKIRNCLRVRYNIYMTLEDIAELLHENPKNYI